MNGRSSERLQTNSQIKNNRIVSIRRHIYMFSIGVCVLFCVWLIRFFVALGVCFVMFARKASELLTP